jgi:hypothetical protein
MIHVLATFHFVAILQGIGSMPVLLILVSVLTVKLYKY